MIPRTLLFISLVCAFATGLRSQATTVPQPQTIWGRVILPDGSNRPVMGIEVRLELDGHAFLNSVTTDEDGKIQFRNVFPGTYHVYINLEGYAPLDQLVQVVAAPKFSLPLEPQVTLTLLRGVTDEVERHTGSAADDLKKEAPLDGPPIFDAGLLKKYPAKAVAEYTDGMTEAVRGNKDKATSHFTKAIGISATFFEAYVQLGILLQQKGQIKEAQDALQRAHEIDPKSSLALTKLGGVLLDKARMSEQQGSKEAAAKGYDEAADILDKATRLDLSSTEAHYLLGSALFKTNELEDAESNLLKAVQAPHPLQQARLMLVNVLMKERRFREALDQLTAYLAAVPDTPQRKAVEQMQSQIRTVVNP